MDATVTTNTAWKTSSARDLSVLLLYPEFFCFFLKVMNIHLA